MKSSRLPAPPIALLKGISSLVPLPREANRLRIGFHPTAEAELDREPMRDAAFFMRSRGQSHSSDGDPREDAEPPRRNAREKQDPAAKPTAAPPVTGKPSSGNGRKS